MDRPDSSESCSGEASQGLGRVWKSFFGACVAAAVVCFGIWAYGHKDDPRFINYTVALMPGVFSFFFGFLPDVRERHMGWRIGIITIGIIWSVVLWRQQVLSEHDQEKAINAAVEKSAAHTDEIIKKTDVKLDAVNGSIAALNQKALIFVEVKPTKPPDANGSVTMPIVIHNKSGVSTGPYTVWVRICDKCRWDGDLAGFQNHSGPDGKDRLRYSEISLDSLIHTDIIPVKFFPPASGERYYIHFYYSCQFCLPGMTLKPNWSYTYFPPYHGK